MNHEELENLSKDDHKQYLYVNPTTDTRNYILPNQATTVGLTIKGALGQKAPLIKFQSFKGEDLGCIKGDGSIKAPKVEVDEAIINIINTKNIKSNLISSEVLECGEVKTSTINGINLEGLRKNVIDHNDNKGIHLTPGEIEHQHLKSSGQYDHNHIDQHINNKHIHLTAKEINHQDISQSGKRTHKEIDDHLEAKHVHYLQEQIEHSRLQELDKDHHKQYVLADGTRGMTRLSVSENLSVGGSLRAGDCKVGDLEGNRIKANSGDLGELQANEIKCEDLYSTKSKAKQILAEGITARRVVVAGDLDVTGNIHGPTIDSITQAFEDHKNNLPAKETHKAFSRVTDGFVPAPKTVVCHDHLFMTSKGNWKSFGQYAEFCFMKGQLFESIADRAYNWNIEQNLVTVPVRGVYEVTLFNIPYIKINQEKVAKSLNTNGSTFLLDLKEDSTTLELELSEDYSRMYIKKIDDYWSYI